jgi:flagellar assembly protein FliH
MPLSKEHQTAYQRWELASFDDRGRTPPVEEAALAIARHAEQLEAELEVARQQGYQEGMSKGYEEGLALGRAQAQEEGMLLKQIAEQFGAEVAHANELIAADVLTLALDVAKAMLKTALPAKPELVLPIVKEAVGYLPTVQQPALLALNPVDAALVKGQMSTELEAAGWRIIEDGRLERGGCRVETASNQIDATTSSRWQRIAAALSAESSWMDA